MYLPALVTQCLWEIDYYRRGKPCTESSCLELFRCAIVENDPEARLWLQYCFGGLVRGWLHRHPQGEAACRLQSEETYVTLAFERFWQVTTSKQRLAFNRLVTALQYLRVSFHGALLDTLRADARPREVALPMPGEPLIEESLERKEVWEVLKTMLTNPRDQRLAYLLFHCGLGPREIIRSCPQEWSSVDEISDLRRIIVG
jgi:hypothetical protein